MSRLIWIDLETTGLDPLTESILEVAAVCTDTDLNVVSTYQAVLPLSRHRPIDDFIREMHTKSGLLDECYALDAPVGEESRADWGIAHLGAKNAVQEDLRQFIVVNSDGEKLPLCGSSVHFDRAFLNTHMPRALAEFGYRNIDVSSIKETVRRFCDPRLHYPKTDDADKAHRALDDVMASIEEYRFYVEEIFFTNNARFITDC